MPTASGIMGQFWTRGVARFNTPPCQGGDRRFESGRVRRRSSVAPRPTYYARLALCGLLKKS